MRQKGKNIDAKTKKKKKVKEQNWKRKTEKKIIEKKRWE